MNPGERESFILLGPLPITSSPPPPSSSSYSGRGGAEMRGWMVWTASPVQGLERHFASRTPVLERELCWSGSYGAQIHPQQNSDAHAHTHTHTHAHIYIYLYSYLYITMQRFVAMAQVRTVFQHSSAALISPAALICPATCCVPP